MNMLTFIEDSQGELIAAGIEAVLNSDMAEQVEPILRKRTWDISWERLWEQYRELYR